MLPHSRQVRPVAFPRRGGASLLMGARPLSPIFPSDHPDRRPDLAPVARWPRLTEVRYRAGCRGFVGPFPPPLWMRSSVVLQCFDNTVTDQANDPAVGRRTIHLRLRYMTNDPSRLLIVASNRGPVSYGYDPAGGADRPPRRGRHGLRPDVGPRGGGGGQRDALAVRGAERGRPGCRPRQRALVGRGTGADARHPAAGLRRRVQRHRQLGPVVRPPHAVRHAEPAALRRRLPGRLGRLRQLQRGLRGGAGAGARARDAGADPGLPPVARAAYAAGPLPVGPDRPLRAHAVGAAGLLPAAAGRRGGRGPRRHPRRRPRRVSRPALGRGVPRLLRGGARGAGDPHQWPVPVPVSGRSTTAAG